ncbi:protein-glutamate O-methyltransferase CheR [Rhizobium sp. CSW-27]|uniref:CheR family methyltransferase n=1 Tax=Rhizobium sp. CSW-27 TaxID=2839985 RepID=UPI001C01D358|nr:protein-glutamate O-methyltransferase CheR [Rhizobium sp. CSW-27]MBT9371597.1 protein-glutamate O-methyltransferase CheR [Rhizobium sp. CSW-27]
MSAAPIQRQPIDDRLSPRNFDRLSKYIYDYSGIKMPITKITMLEGRLRRRLRVTGIASFDDYCDYLFKQDGMASEQVYLIDAVTTNKTDFFREPKHFEYMAQKAVPELLADGVSSLRVWSAACSTGAEPYTIAMVLSECLADRRNADYRVIATDLSTEVLQVARKAIYPAEMVSPVPADLQRRYVMQARDPARGEVRIAPSLRQKVGFGRLNLMDESYAVSELQHIIFCRNVLIYFDKPTQLHVLGRLCDCLAPGGYLFIGHSETATGFNLPIRQVANTVFKRV